MDPALPDGVACVPVRTPTLPPATHTNTWLLGAEELTVVDPASPWEDERRRLFDALDRRLAAGARVRRLLLTHHHQDHVSGAVDLRERLAAGGHPVPVAAHPVTAALVASAGIKVDELVEDGDELLDGVVAVHTPGHAPGHLALAGPGYVVAGDMVAGVGTIVLDPREGDLQDYLDSLERLRALGAAVLLPAHGPALPHADAVLSFYVAHRHHRTTQVAEALDRAGRATPLDLAPVVYPELDRAMHPVAAAQIETHLRFLERHGRAREHGGTWRAA